MHNLISQDNCVMKFCFIICLIVWNFKLIKFLPQGDSGGPFTVADSQSGAHTLVGAVSFGFGCARVRYWFGYGYGYGCGYGHGYGCAMVHRSCTTFIRNLLTASLTVLWLLYCIHTTCTLSNSANQTSNLHKLYWPHLNHIQEGLYGVYADVPFFRTWIDEQIAAKGGATFCS